MADIKDLEAAFLKADTAGNVEDAQAFATEIKRLRAAPQSKPLPANAGMANFGATVAGLPVDTIENAINLTLAAQGGVAGLMGRTDFMPPVIEGSFGGTESIKRGLRSTGIAGLNPDNPTPDSAMGTAQYNLASRGAMIPGLGIPALAATIAEKVLGPQWAGVAAMTPAAAGATARAMAPNLSPQAQTLTAEKVALTPGQQYGGTVKRIEDAATSVPVL